MTKREAIEKNARAMLADRSMEDLLEMWEKTTDSNDPNVFNVRGWLMDEIELRKPAGFNCWLQSGEALDSTLRCYVMPDDVQISLSYALQDLSHLVEEMKVDWGGLNVSAEELLDQVELEVAQMLHNLGGTSNG